MTVQVISSSESNQRILASQKSPHTMTVFLEETARMVRASSFISAAVEQSHSTQRRRALDSFSCGVRALVDAVSRL